MVTVWSYFYLFSPIRMTFIVRFLFIQFLYVNVLISYAAEDENPQNVKNGSKYLSESESIGILPIGEIIRKSNLPYLVFTKSTTDNVQNVSIDETTTEMIPFVKHHSKTSLMKTFLKGRDDDVMGIPYKKILRNLKYIDKVDLSQRKKFLIWEIIKNEKPVYIMNRQFLKGLYGLLYDIPENEYVYFNVSDWDLLNFFGTSKLLTRRRAAIIAYAIMHQHGEIIIRNSKHINKLKGLICGFSEYNLKMIPTNTFRSIDKSVFRNLWSCTREQIQILLEIAQRPEVYGPYELWDERILHKIALLVTVIKVEDFQRFYVNAFNGLESEVVDAMSDDQCEWLSRKNLGPTVKNLLANYNLKRKNGNDPIFYGLYILVVTAICLLTAKP